MSTKKTIAKSFTVSTIEDGVSVQAQYAPNANPTSGQIHTVWQTGDLYMRTRESDDAVWSSWHKIVGESGDETDFSFGISQYKTTDNASTAPSDISSWSDAPLAVTTAKPYLWAKVQQKSWNASTQAYVVDSTRYVRLTGEPGTSPYFADLNNEMDAIQCKHDGGVITAQTVSTVISMWKGSAVEAFVIDNIYRNGTQLTWDYNNSGVWPRVSGSTVSIEFDTNASISDIDDFKITIHSYNDNTVTRELHFTINGVRANAVYRLIPSVSQVVKKKDGSYTPNTDITCVVQKVENGNPSTPLSSEYTLEKSLNGGAYIPYSATQSSQITTDLKFRLKIDGSVVDIETIPLVQDGSNGDNAIEYAIVFTNAWARVNNYGIISAQMSGYAYIINGTSRTPLANATIRYGYILNDADTYATTTTNASGFFDTRTWFDGDEISTYAKNSGNIFAAIIIGGTSVVCVEYVTIAKQGENGTSIVGPRGKVGRFFYYAGIFDASDKVTTFVVNDAQSPYFLYDNNYWVYNPENNPSGGISTMFDMGTPSSESASWKIMTSDFKYIITEAIFGSYAHFGGAIINGDYLMSQYGYMLGFCNTKTPINDNTQYQNVDMDDVLGDDDMYDPTKLIWNDSNQREITSTTYTTITSALLVQNRYYTLEIDENTEVSGNEMLWTIVSQSGTEIASGTIISTATGTNKNCVNFKSTVSETCYLRVKVTNQNDPVDINSFYLRFAKFIPYLAMDLLAGKFVANNIIARGELHADSLYHTMVYGNSNDDRFTINDESIVNLGTRAVGTTVILPSPTICKGRVIELFNHATSYSVTWVGALSTSTFSASYGSGLGIRVLYPISYQYVKFYCDGTNWWILKAEA